MNSALRQCVCGHQQHDGPCPENRGGIWLPCMCEEFIDSSECVSGYGLLADKSTWDSVAGTEPTPRLRMRCRTTSRRTR